MDIGTELERKRLRSYMENEYERLLRDMVMDAAQWQAVHRVLPVVAEIALKGAMLKCGWEIMVMWVMRVSQSSAMLFTSLPGGSNYDERTHTAVFTNGDSAQIFGSRWPGFNVMLEEDTAVGVED